MAESARKLSLRFHNALNEGKECRFIDGILWPEFQARPRVHGQGDDQNITDSIPFEELKKDGGWELWQTVTFLLNVHWTHTWYDEETGRLIENLLWDYGNQGMEICQSVVDYQGQVVPEKTNMALWDMATECLNYDMEMNMDDDDAWILDVPSEFTCCLTNRRLTAAQVNAMPVMTRFRRETLTIMAIQFRQSRGDESFQHIFNNALGERFGGYTALHVVQMMMALNGIRIHCQFLVRELLPAFRERLVKMADGTPYREWRCYQNHDMNGNVHLVMPVAEIAWATT